MENSHLQYETEASSTNQQFFFPDCYIQIFYLEYKINHIHYNIPELKKTSSNPCTIDTNPVTQTDVSG